MKIYSIDQEFSSDEDIENSNQELQVILKDLEQKYVGLALWAYENKNKIKLDKIEVPKDMRNQGIGSEIIKIIQDFAQKRKKPLVVAPEAERGHKKNLDNFYKGHGFINNKGRNKDYSISEPFGATMYWRPQDENI